MTRKLPKEWGSLAWAKDCAEKWLTAGLRSNSKKLRTAAEKFAALYPKKYCLLGVLDGTKRTMLFGFNAHPCMRGSHDLRKYNGKINMLPIR